MKINRTTAALLFLTALAFILAVLVLVLAAKVDRAGDAPIASAFTDTEGHWAEGYIEQIRLAGLTAGCSADPSMYCPDQPLTRAEAAVFLARVLELSR